MPDSDTIYHPPEVTRNDPPDPEVRSQKSEIFLGNDPPDPEVRGQKSEIFVLRNIQMVPYTITKNKYICKFAHH